jgi:hypothetical protein
MSSGGRLTQVTEEKWEIFKQDIEGFEHRQYLDGKKVYDWLWRDNPELMEGHTERFGEAITRRLYEWSVTTHPVHYSSADRILTKLGFHIDFDVPEDCWLPVSIVRNKSKHSEARERGIKLLREGKPVAGVAKELGINRKTVAGWSRQIRQEDELAEQAERTKRREESGDSWLAGLVEHGSIPKTWMRETG